MPRLVVVIALFIAAPLAAQTDLGVHVAAARASSTDAAGTTLSFDHGRGFGASILLRERFELAATWLRYDGAMRTEGTSASLGALRLVPVTAAAQWRFDEHVYVGAGAAYVIAKALSSTDLDALGVGDVHVRSKACWLANAGVVVPLRDVAVVVDVKYLDYRPASGEGPGVVRLKLRPVIVSAGVRWRR